SRCITLSLHHVLCVLPVLSFSTLPTLPRHTLFPYTTLFRSNNGTAWRCMFDPISARFASSCSRKGIREAAMEVIWLGATSIRSRSEEHTSELQSRENLVCRLLLEKKNNISSFSVHTYTIWYA